MHFLQSPTLGEAHDCPYLPQKTARLMQFLALGLSADEINDLLLTGWRKFGPYFFRPACESCCECIPVRVLVDEFRSTSSQRRNTRRNHDVVVSFDELRCSDEVFDIYQDHSRNRFGTTAVREEFEASFFQPSCPSLQSEFRLDGKLIAAGFLDVSTQALSTVYFVFRTEHSPRGLGIFSVIQEILYARSQGRMYYYLGYCVRENRSLNYKARFLPHEYYDWGAQEWVRK